MISDQAFVDFAGHQPSFQGICTLLVVDPHLPACFWKILAFPDFSWPFDPTLNASREGTGSALYQV